MQSPRTILGRAPPKNGRPATITETEESRYSGALRRCPPGGADRSGTSVARPARMRDWDLMRYHLDTNVIRSTAKPEPFEPSIGGHSGVSVASSWTLRSSNPTAALFARRVLPFSLSEVGRHNNVTTTTPCARNADCHSRGGKWMSRRHLRPTELQRCRSNRFRPGRQMKSPYAQHHKVDRIML
jgi:hypothetical protein